VVTSTSYVRMDISAHFLMLFSQHMRLLLDIMALHNWILIDWLIDRFSTRSASISSITIFYFMNQLQCWIIRWLYTAQV